MKKLPAEKQNTQEQDRLYTPEVPYKTEQDLRELLSLHEISLSMINKAIDLAKKVHAGQDRDSGAPYLEEHIWPVCCELITSFHQNLDIIGIVVLALTHDCYEDSSDFSDAEYIEAFGEDLYRDLMAISKTPEENKEGISQVEKFNRNRIYISRVAKSNFRVRIVKLADRKNNVQCLECIKDTPKFSRYINETRELFLPLAQNTFPLYYDELDSLLRYFENHKG